MLLFGPSRKPSASSSGTGRPQPFPRDGLIGMEKKERKQGTLPGPTQGKRPFPLHRFEGAEDAEFELSALLAHVAERARKGAVSES